MAFSIFKVVDIAGGKITAELINNTQAMELETLVPYKFTFVKSSDLEVVAEEGATFDISFKYKDNF